MIYNKIHSILIVVGLCNHQRTYVDNHLFQCGFQHSLQNNPMVLNELVLYLGLIGISLFHLPTSKFSLPLVVCYLIPIQDETWSV
jgi:hypothetical protein